MWKALSNAEKTLSETSDFDQWIAEVDRLIRSAHIASRATFERASSTAKTAPRCAEIPLEHSPLGAKLVLHQPARFLQDLQDLQDLQEAAGFLNSPLDEVKSPEHLFWKGLLLILPATYRTLKLRQQLRPEEIYQDDTTGLYNKAYLKICVQREIERSNRYDHRFCLLFFDLNNFKAINDSFGHLQGDKVLRLVADTIKRELRAVDLVFRYGGDEFVALLVQSNLALGEMTAQRILDRLAMIKTADLKPNAVGASVGVACFPTDGQSYENLIAVSDRKMYLAKPSLEGHSERALDQNSSHLL